MQCRLVSSHLVSEKHNDSILKVKLIVRRLYLLRPYEVSKTDVVQVFLDCLAVKKEALRFSERR
jgi:hypothetical protein